ncbi:MAG: chemotaxis protein CheW [Gammaproteobacteria bacterium]|nr:chemotaxis protein CheW [Gammaproteobacteria bacterium]
MAQKKDNKLLNPSSAVEDYFDSLLQDVALEQDKTGSNGLKGGILLMPELRSDLAKIDQETAVPSAESEPAAVTDDDSAQDSAADDAQPGYELPIQCLMFQVGDQQLSMPLIDMGSVVPWVDKLTSLPHSPDWFLGLLQYRDKNVKVADTAGMLQIERAAEAGHPGHMLVFADETWAITCDQLGDVVELHQEDVKWASPDANNPTLGTIKQSLAILLDPGKIINILKQQENLH